MAPRASPAGHSLPKVAISFNCRAGSGVGHDVNGCYLLPSVACGLGWRDLARLLDPKAAPLLWGVPRYFPDKELTSPSHPNLATWWASFLPEIPFMFTSS